VRLALPLVLALTGAAHAESEQAFSIGFGYATFSAPGEPMDGMPAEAVSPTFGLSLTATYERAIGTDVALRAEVVTGGFWGGTTKDDQRSTSYAVLGDAGIAFRFDVMKYVPYAFGGLGAVGSGGGPLTGGVDFVLVAGGGLDWLQSRERSYGLELRLASFAGDITVATLGLRGTWRWGFF
jgi:hypothetical protein